MTIPNALPASSLPAPQRPEDISAEWLGAALRAGGLDVCVVSAAAIPIKQSAGVLSSLIRYELQYHGPNVGPSSIVAKLLTSDPENRRYGLGVDLWQRESQFYREIAPYIGVRIPKCYFVAADPDRDCFAILLEDLTGREQPTHVSHRRAVAAIVWLADLHAIWWGRAASSFPWLEQEASFEKRMRTAVEANWSEFVALAHVHKVPHRHIVLIERSIARLGEGLTGGLLTPTLIHYDYRIGNMMFRGEDDLVVFDWPSPLIGQAPTDLSWFLKDSISPSDRRSKERALAGVYLDRLTSRGVNARELNSFERQMVLSHLRRLPMSVLLATTFKNLAHADEGAGPIWWARDYDELEHLWRLSGGSL